MKKIVFLSCFFLQFFCYSQGSKDFEVKKLSTSYDFTKNENYKFNFNDNEIAVLEKERRISKTMGFVLAGLGLAATSTGIIVINDNKNDQEGVGITAGAMIITFGGLSLGGSVPFFISAKKRKRKIETLKNYEKNMAQ